MEALNRIHGAAIEYMLSSKAVDLSTALIGMSCRDSMPGGCDVFLFADTSVLYALSGVVTLGDGGAEFTETSYAAYPLDLVSELETEELVSSARLSVRSADSRVSLVAETSNTYKDTLFRFADYVKLIKLGDFKGVEEDDREKYCPTCGRRFPDDNRICPYCADNSGIIKKLLPFFGRYMKSMIAIFAMMGVISLLSVVSPYVGNSFFIDEVLTGGGKFYGQVLLVIVMLVSVRLADMLITVINDLVTARITANITYDLKKTIFSAINRLSLGFFNSRRTGGLMTQIESDSSTLYRFFSEMTPNLIISAVKIIAMLIVMLFMNPLLALIAVAATPIYVLLLQRTFYKSKHLAIVYFTKSKSLSSKLSDILTGMRVVKAFAKEEHEKKKFLGLSREKTGLYYRWTMHNAAAYPAISFLLYLASMAVWAAGGIAVFKGEMSYGDLLTFVAYMGMFYNPLNYIITSMRHMGDCFNAASRLFEIADAIPDVNESKTPVVLDSFEGGIEFKNVSFSYTKSRKTIDKVSFSVPAGSTLGIVGRTGAGKSTIANLLIRLYDVGDGEILIDGVNVKDMSFEQLRRNIAIVSQETFLFSGTIYENIAYAMPNATYEEVLNAAIEAGAHDFIIKLPDAYQTRIGFGYKDLSGGERQRISIARALLRRPRILILDEATAAMDTATEEKIERALNKLSGSATTIMIAHRLSTLRSADRLIVIEDGKMSESGTHEELLQQEGIYHKLYTLQLEALANIISDGSADESHAPRGRRGKTPKSERE